MNNLEYFELYPNIDVYKNVLINPQDFYNIIKRSESENLDTSFFRKWDKWAHFGTYTQKKWTDEYSSVDLNNNKFIEEKQFVDQVEEAYSLVLKDYTFRHNIELKDGWHFSGCSFCKYDSDVNTLKNEMTMQYHTDFIISQKDMPGDKFKITCTMYINDDYEGGDLEFFIDGNIITYKPNAGDIVVFPSDAPYYHGVKVIKNGHKYFVRNFIMEPFEGTNEWLENQKRYGAYKWGQMESKRIDFEDDRNMIYLIDGRPVKYEDLPLKYNEVSILDGGTKSFANENKEQM